MKVTEDALLKSGFNASELQRIKENIKVYGGDLEEAIHDLSNSFRTLLWITEGAFCTFVLLLLFSSEQKIVGGSFSLLLIIAIVSVLQPPRLAYKSWRYWKKHRTNSDSAPR